MKQARKAGENSNLFFCNLPSVYGNSLPDTKWKILRVKFLWETEKGKNVEMGGV